MKVVAAYLLAVIAGNQKPEAKDVSNILSSVGAEVDDEEVNKVIEQLAGKDIDDLIKQGKEKLAAVPGGSAPAAGGAAPAAAAGGAKKEEEKPAEKPKEESGGVSSISPLPTHFVLSLFISIILL